MLKQSRNYFFIYQRLDIFLQIMGKGDNNWDLQKTFQYLSIIISLVFHEILASLLILYKKIIILPNASKLLDFCITNDTKYFLCFKNCLEVLNGTHLLAHLPSVIALPY